MDPDPVPVSAEMRWTCVGIAVTGALLFMAGIMLAFAWQVLGEPDGMPTLGVVAGGLILAGLFCGVLLIIASRPLSSGKPGNGRPPGGQPGSARTPGRQPGSGRPPAGKPGSKRPAKRGRVAPDQQLPAGTVGPPGTSEEWIRGLRH